MKLKKDQTTTLIITHFVIRTNQGPAAPSIFNYLLHRSNKMAYIELPFPHAKNQNIYLSIYKDEDLFSQIIIPNIKGPNFLQYIYHIFVSIFFVLLAGRKFDICIACENLSLISVVIFRKIGVIKKLIYYSIDYTKNRFDNFLVNKIYHMADKYSCRLSDINWVVTKQQIDARNVKYNIKDCSPFEIVPIGYDLKEFNSKPTQKINYHHLVYAGGFIYQSGIQLAIETLPQLKTKYPKIRLIIIGSGVYESKLKNLIRELKVTKFVKFLGHIENFYSLIEILKQQSIGLAPFLPIPGSLSYLSDPSKIKLYLFCKLPVITTDVTTIASTLKKYQAGLVINPDKDNLAKAVDYLLANRQRYSVYKKNASVLAKKYDIKRILDNAFKNL